MSALGRLRVSFCRTAWFHRPKQPTWTSIARLALNTSRYNNNSARGGVVLTSERYPSLQRGDYTAVTDKHIAFFEGLLPGRVISDVRDLDGYNTDWLKTCRGASQLLLRPKTTEEVSQILRYCNENQLAVVPQGGNTGLVGGSVPVFDEIIISTQLMNKVFSVDEISGTLVCQSGCILGNLETLINEHDLTMPLDLGAKGSCHIGGNLATNAGGIRLLRFGSLHGNVLGLEAVLPNGDVLDSLTTLRKDNTGYDVKQMFIGSEGTLGIITAVSILCAQKPSSVNVAFVGCEDFPTVLKVLQRSKENLAEILSAFEFIDRQCMALTERNLNLTNPITDNKFYALIETSGSNPNHDEEKLNHFLETLMEDGIVRDGTLATETSKVQAIWGLRERLAEALMHDGYCYKYDVSLPLSHFYELVEVMRERLGDKAVSVVGYGHVGDCNLHFNATTREFDEEVMGLIEPFIYDWVAEHKGSISAEHGLGFKKKDFIYHSKSKAAVQLMKDMKRLLDPNGILNPYKTLPTD
ncbi:D-2-hydroxyglutarate dehydrogenase, mitochondrial-like [Liolophura sinensis]|uniref:D-2-hydroxyglutarate dehydrogenase, mitochondrial-like n=1 Tax=Liolophura sinensis TaxID=3198878 RepID=UPI00315939B7